MSDREPDRAREDEGDPPSLSAVPLVGVAVNAALACVKILAGFFGNSYALIADGIESTSDIVTSLVVWGGLRVSVAPADERHPYGYGKAEALSGIVDGRATVQTGHEIGGRVRSGLRASPLRIADAFIHIEPDSRA